MALRLGGFRCIELEGRVADDDVHLGAQFERLARLVFRDRQCFRRHLRRVDVACGTVEIVRFLGESCSSGPRRDLGREEDIDMCTI